MSAATNTRNVRSFSSGDYIAGLMAELNKAAISQRVAQARTQAGLTQGELADLLHVHTKTVQNWESKAHPIVAYDRLDEIARATGVEWDWLLHGEREEAAVSAASLVARLEALEALTATGFQALEAAIEQIAEQLRPPGQSEGGGT